MEEFRRGFGYWAVLSLAIGSIAGTTLFFGVGITARYSGNMILLSWALLSAVAIYIAACFGELASTFPKAGGSYEFAKQAYGRFTSFIVGWTAWLLGNLATVVMIVGATSFLFPHTTGFNQFLISLGIIIALNSIAYLSVAASSLVLIFFAILMIAVPFVLIIKGLPIIHLQNFNPFFTHPLPSILVSAFFMLESYFGWESATYLAEETRNPRKTIPKALVHATLLIALTGFFLIATIIGLIGLKGLTTSPAPFIELANLLFSDKIKLAVSIGAYLALIGSAASGIIALPRLVLALARDRLLPGQFKAIHPRFNTPYNAVLFQTVALVGLLVLGFANYESLLSIFVPIGVLLYITLLIAVPVLRAKYPDAPRGFKVPFPKVGVPLVIAVLVSTVASWGITVPGSLQLLQLSFYLVAIGLPLYLLVELYYDPKMITEVNDMLAYLTLFTEKLTFTAGMKNEIFSFMGNLQGKTILEFGCGVGTLTVELVKRIGVRGRVIATHFSKNNLKITSKRIDDIKWGTPLPIAQVTLLHDPEMFRRVHPEVTYADMIVSAGMLANIQEMKTVLKEMWAILPVGGKLCLTDYTDLFHLLPNVEWLASETAIEKLFTGAGFSVRVVKLKSLLWNRIFIYGVKTTGHISYI